jgi:hypothetical protein
VTDVTGFGSVAIVETVILQRVLEVLETKPTVVSARSSAAE